MEITDSDDDDDLDYDEKYIEYSWDNKNGMDITLTTYENDEEIAWVEIDWTKTE